MLSRGTHGYGSHLGQETGPTHPCSEVPCSSASPHPSLPVSPLSPHFPPSISNPFIPEGAAEPPSGWVPAVKRQSPLTLACWTVKELTSPGIRLDPKLLRKNTDNPLAPSSLPLRPLSSFTGPGNAAADSGSPWPHLPVRALKIYCTERWDKEPRGSHRVIFLEEFLRK